MPVFNVLKEWRKEFDVHSSDLNPKKWCNRKDIYRVESILLDYFGEDFFTKKIKGTEIHIIHTLLLQYTKPSLISLFEIANLLEYLSRLSSEIQRKFKSHCMKPRQFQDTLFEIYTYRILEGNRINVIKAPFIDNQELEGICTINSKKFLFECRKSNSAIMNEIDCINYIERKLRFHLEKRMYPFNFIGYLRIKKYCGNTKSEFTSKLKYILCTEQVVEQVEFDYISFEAKEYNETNLIEYNLMNEDDTIKFRYFLIEENRVKGNHYGIEIIPQITISQNKITKKLIETIRKKRNQHKNSTYENRIIFIDCEVQTQLQFPLMMDESMLEPDKIDEYLKSKDTNDIVVIFIRNYGNEKPKKRTCVFGKNEFDVEKRILEKLKTRFAVKYYQNGILSYRPPFET